MKITGKGFLNLKEDNEYKNKQFQTFYSDEYNQKNEIDLQRYNNNNIIKIIELTTSFLANPYDNNLPFIPEIKKDYLQIPANISIKNKYIEKDGTKYYYKEYTKYNKELKKEEILQLKSKSKDLNFKIKDENTVVIEINGNEFETFNLPVNKSKIGESLQSVNNINNNYSKIYMNNIQILAGDKKIAVNVSTRQGKIQNLSYIIEDKLTGYKKEERDIKDTNKIKEVLLSNILPELRKIQNEIISINRNLNNIETTNNEKPKINKTAEELNERINKLSNFITKNEEFIRENAMNIDEIQQILKEAKNALKENSEKEQMRKLIKVIKKKYKTLKKEVEELKEKQKVEQNTERKETNVVDNVIDEDMPF